MEFRYNSEHPNPPPTMQDGVVVTQQGITWSKTCTENIDAIWPNCVLPDIYCAPTLLTDTCNAESKLLPGIAGLFGPYNDKSEMALQAFNAAVVSTRASSVKDDGLKASRTPLTHDSRNSSIPHFFINPSGWTSMPAEIINQRVMVKKIIENAGALRNHKFQVDLSYKKMFPMNVFDTVEIAREITEVTYSGAWSDIIDAECRNSPIESLMNRKLMLKNLETSRKQHLAHVEAEIWELFKLTMDLKEDTRTLIGVCRDAETLQRSMMNPCLRHAPVAPRPKKQHTQHPASFAQSRITLSA